jgi:WD40 repeat protein
VASGQWSVEDRRDFGSNLAMSIKRLAIALMLGLLAFGVVLYWPASPLWRVPVSPHTQVVSASPSGETIFVWDWEKGDRTVVEQRVKDGAVVRRLTMPPEGDDWGLWDIKAAAGGTKLFARSLRGRTHGNFFNSHHRMLVLDVGTGAILSGPFPFVGSSGTDPLLSADGRWLAVYDHEREVNWVVYSTETGKATVIQPRHGYSFSAANHGCCFSPDSSSFAVVWGTRTGAGAVGLYDPATGNELKMVPLPAKKDGWGELVGWSGSSLEFRSKIRDVVTAYHHTYSLELSNDQFGIPRHEPACDGFDELQSPNGDANRVSASLAGDRVVRQVTGRMAREGDWWWRARAWCDEKFKTKWAPTSWDDVLVQILRRDTGRMCFNIHTRNHYHCVAPDGRWIAVVDEKRGLEVWDADPWPRWPWALGAGAVVAAMVMFLKRRRGPAGPVRV